MKSSPKQLALAIGLVAVSAVGIPLVLVATLALVGCSPMGRQVRVRDVTTSETIILKKRPDKGSITGISIHGKGSITGTAEIQLILNGSVYKREPLSGPASFKWEGDWYADDAEVRYLSGSASSGTLTLIYAFHSL